MYFGVSTKLVTKNLILFTKKKIGGISVESTKKNLKNNISYQTSNNQYHNIPTSHLTSEYC